MGKRDSSAEAGALAPSDVLGQTYQRLKRAEELRRSGTKDNLAAARKLCEELVGDHPKYFGALYTLGLIYIDQQEYERALTFLIRAAMLNTRHWQVLTALSAVYQQLGSSDMAAITLERAREIAPNEPSILVTLGEIYRAEQEIELAIGAYRAAHELDPQMRAPLAGLSTCNNMLGRHEEAAKCVTALIGLGKTSLGTLYEVNSLPPGMIDIDVMHELAKTRKATPEPDIEFEIDCMFLEAGALHRQGQFERAWQLLLEANSRKFLPFKADAEKLRDLERRALNAISNRVPAKVYGRCDKNIPVTLFIQGPSRSGKTTLEKLLTGIEGLKTGHENPSVEIAVRRTFQSAGLLASSIFEMLPRALDQDCACFYADEVMRRAAGQQVFTNTNPSRIHDAARIAEAFPNPRFVFIRRDIADNLVRIFMRKYRDKNFYAYRLESIRDHLLWYHQMIDEMQKKYPDIVRIVQYEDMVANTEEVVSGVLEFCGLDPASASGLKAPDDRGFARPYKAWLR